MGAIRHRGFPLAPFPLLPLAPPSCLLLAVGSWRSLLSRRGRAAATDWHAKGFPFAVESHPSSGRGRHFGLPLEPSHYFFFLSQGPVEGFPRHCPSPSHALSDERIGAAIGQRQRLLGQSEDLPCRITRGDSPSRRPSIWQPLQNRRWGFSLCISTCASTATRRWLCPGSATAPTRNPMRGRCAVLASSPSWASSASPRTKSYRRPIVLS